MRFLPSVVVAIVLLLAAACSHSPASDPVVSATKPPRHVPPSAFKLTEGMPSKTVLDALGGPKTKKLIKTASGSGEIWIYQQSREEYDQMISAGGLAANEVLFTYSRDGIDSYVTSIGSNSGTSSVERRHHVEKTTLILMINGTVVEWDRSHKENNSLK